MYNVCSGERRNSEYSKVHASPLSFFLRLLSGSPPTEPARRRRNKRTLVLVLANVYLERRIEGRKLKLRFKREATRSRRGGGCVLFGRVWESLAVNQGLDAEGTTDRVFGGSLRIIHSPLSTYELLRGAISSIYKGQQGCPILEHLRYVSLDRGSFSSLTSVFIPRDRSEDVRDGSTEARHRR